MEEVLNYLELIKVAPVPQTWTRFSRGNVHFWVVVKGDPQEVCRDMICPELKFTHREDTPDWVPAVVGSVLTNVLLMGRKGDQLFTPMDFIQVIEDELEEVKQDALLRQIVAFHDKLIQIPFRLECFKDFVDECVPYSVKEMAALLNRPQAAIASAQFRLQKRKGEYGCIGRPVVVVQRTFTWTEFIEKGFVRELRNTFYDLVVWSIMFHVCAREAPFCASTSGADLNSCGKGEAPSVSKEGTDSTVDRRWKSLMRAIDARTATKGMCTRSRPDSEGPPRTPDEDIMQLIPDHLLGLTPESPVGEGFSPSPPSSPVKRGDPVFSPIDPVSPPVHSYPVSPSTESPVAAVAEPSGKEEIPTELLISSAALDIDMSLE